MSDLIRAMLDGRMGESISVLDRALNYGDGVFESIRLQKGALECWTLHAQRMRLGCERLGLTPPDPAVLLCELQQLVGAQHAGVIKIVLSAGVGKRGYARSGTATRRILMLFAATTTAHDWSKQGITLHTCRTRLGRNTALAGIKHLNRLEQVLAARELPEACQEGIMLDERGFVIEGIMSNVFAIKANTLYTPTLTCCGVAGVMRAVVLEVAEKFGLRIEIRDQLLAEWLESDEIFVCNSLIRLWPVRQWETRWDFSREVTQGLIQAVNRFIKINVVVLNKGSLC